MKLSDLRHPRLLLNALEHRRVRPLVWNRLLAQRIASMSDAEFLHACGWDSNVPSALERFHEQARLRFFFHPRNRKDFFLNTLAFLQPEEHILADADATLVNRFQTLGSPLTELGETMPWHRDFKSGKDWPVARLTNDQILDLGHSSDVKVPWELSRFHQTWWLGKAYWLTGNERYAAKFRDLVTDWIDKNPVGIGVNWTVSMEVAIRACNWIAGYYFFCTSKSCDEAFWLRFLKSLYAHGRFIEFNLEYSRNNGNHFLSDVVGQVFLGTFFNDTPFGKRWLNRGTIALEREMRSQVSPDGVDFEKSTSYHRLVLELFMSATLLGRINNRSFSAEYMNRLERMVEFVQHYSRPDGSVPLWGDADDGRLFRFCMDDNVNDHRHALSTGAVLFERNDFALAAQGFHQETLWYFGGEGFERFRMLGGGTAPGSRAFEEGGFFIMRNEQAYAFIDAGELGQRGRGGHGHNDTLGFEFWVNGGPLVVDSGTYAYTFDVEARQEFRSTRSHNTVMVDGTELADFNGLWEVREDTTKPHVTAWRSTADIDTLEAMHFAYQRLPSPVVHRRIISLDKKTLTLAVEDHLTGTGMHRVESFLHLAPGADVESVDGRQVSVKRKEERFLVTASAGDWSVRETWFSRSYGVRERKKTLVLLIEGSLPASMTVVIRPA